MKVIQKMFTHMHWANHRILEGLKTMNVNHGDHQQAVRLFAHILHAELVWFNRLQGKDSSHIPLWTNLEISACEELVHQNNENYSKYLHHLTSANLEDFIYYKNTAGKEFATTVGDILTHIAFHGQYHRGQMNSLLRQHGYDPVNVDFITFVR